MFFETLNTVIAFIITLGILVTFHEFGHFWVARRCGVRVLRFSVGFGKPIFRWYDKHKTEFCISVIPLGGYVKMLDEREADVNAEDKPYSFLSQPARNKIAIVAAGPLANFLLAIILLWAMYMIGLRVITPVVGEVVAESIAQTYDIKSGDIIKSINGKPTVSWQAVEMQLATLTDNNMQINMVIERDDSEHRLDLWINDWHNRDIKKSGVNFLGITPKSAEVAAILGFIEKNGAADRAGLQIEDVILTADNIVVNNWRDFVNVIRTNPEKKISLEVERQKEKLLLDITPDIKLTDEGKIGYIGCKFKPVEDPSMFKILRYDPVTALIKGIEGTFNLLYLTAASIWNMVRGLVSIENIGGPITIAKFAGVSMGMGLDSFLSFLAMLSVSLGFLNLLPIPALDGGHLLFHVIEWVKGSPLSEKVQLFFLRIGVSMITALMLFSILNDLMRNL